MDAPPRAYGRDPHADVSAILREVLAEGQSCSWHGSPTRRAALAHILARYGVACVDPERGRWERTLFFTR